MRFINIVILGIVLCSFLLAQNNVNNLVHKSKKIDPQYEHLIYDYRIPDWGYHHFYLDFSTNLNGSNDKYHPDRYENERDNSQYNGMLRPYFYLYRTSEKYIFTVYSGLNSSYGYYQDRYEYGSTIQKSFNRYRRSQREWRGHRLGRPHRRGWCRRRARIIVPDKTALKT